MLERKIITNKNTTIIKMIKNEIEYSTKIDTDDLNKIVDKNMYIGSNNYFTLYDNDTKKQIYLSRFLMLDEVEKQEKIEGRKMVVDHINGDIYDNRKQNLRVVNYAKNRVNTNKNKIQGIFKVAKKSWCVYVGTLRLGTFSKYEEAVKARIQGELLVYGDCSRLNQDIIKKYNVNTEGIKVNCEYLNKKEYKEIVDFVVANKNVNTIANMRFNSVVLYKNNNYIYIKDVLRKVNFYTEDGIDKIKITEVKILKNEIRGVK